MNPCPSCATVHFAQRRIHRNGSLAVAAGHLLLVPSILTLVLGSMGVVSRPAPTPDAARGTSAELAAAGIPARLVAQVAAHQPLSGTELEALTEEQQQSVFKAQMAVADGSTRESIHRFTSGRTFPFLVGLALAGGILGWFLVRKESIAQCINCGSVATPRAEAG